MESIFQDNQRANLGRDAKRGCVSKVWPVCSRTLRAVRDRHSITEDSAGNVWMSHQEGLFHLLRSELVERIPWAKLGRGEPATALLHDSVQGGLWLGFRDGGVAYFQDGQLRASYAAVEGLGEGMVRSFYIDGNGTLWAATEGGLSRIKDGRVLTLTKQNGLPCNTVHWMMEDDADSVWLYLACGLVRIAGSELDAWASDPSDDTGDGVRQFDGVSSHLSPGGYSAIVAKSADGKLWFLRFGGVSVIDPHHLAVQQASAAGTHRAGHRRRQDLRRLEWLATAGRCARLAVRLHGAELGGAGEGTFPRDAGGPGQRLAGAGQPASCSLHEPPATHVPLPRDGLRTTAACGTRKARCWISRSRRRTTRPRGSAWPFWFFSWSCSGRLINFVSGNSRTSSI